MDQFLPMVGSYFWWIVAGILLLAEMALPGFFMLWLAVAAALTAILDLIFHFSAVQEIFCFAVLAFLCVLASWKFVMNLRHSKTDSPHLNQRHHGLIGRSFVLDRAIVNGRGKIEVEDTLWDVEGPDMAVGSRVKVISVQGMRLMVEAV